jgi:fructokinase
MPGPIVVAGEALMDVVADGDRLRAHPGGGPFTTARTLGRLGRPVAYLGCLSSDAFGTRLRTALEADGVSLAAAVASDAPTTLALATISPGGGASYGFYVEGTAAPALTPAAALAALPPDLSVLHVGTLGLVLEPMAAAVESVVDAVGDDVLVALDPNCRPEAIRDQVAYRERIGRVMARADLVKLSDEDLAYLRAGEHPIHAARALLAAGPAAVVMTRGPRGALVLRGGDTFEIPAPQVEVADTIGAGDAFGAGLLAWWHAHGLGRDDLARGPELNEAAAYAAQVAARTCERPGADPPRSDEVARLLP